MRGLSSTTFTVISETLRSWIKNKRRESQVGRTKLPPTRFRVLIPRIYEYVTLHGKWDLVKVIKVKDPEKRRVSWIILAVLESGEPFQISENQRDGRMGRT